MRFRPRKLLKYCALAFVIFVIYSIIKNDVIPYSHLTSDLDLPRRVGPANKVEETGPWDKRKLNPQSRVDGSDIAAGNAFRDEADIGNGNKPKQALTGHRRRNKEHRALVLEHKADRQVVKEDNAPLANQRYYRTSRPNDKAFVKLDKRQRENPKSTERHQPKPTLPGNQNDQDVQGSSKKNSTKVGIADRELPWRGIGNMTGRIFPNAPVQLVTEKTALDQPVMKSRVPVIVFDPDKFNKSLLAVTVGQKSLDPANRPGEMGKPVILEPQLEEKAKYLFHENAFNLIASDRIAFNRSLPDFRPEACKSINYSSSLPNTSVIIIFHNEAWSTLLRTVHSVLNRSPPHLLAEVILVDDASKKEFLKRKLDDYISRHFNPPKVRVERLLNRSGLIRARIHGALVAKGTVLTFLDSHCEVTTGWLEPLLSRVQQDRRNVVTPVIDVINDKTFEYRGHTSLPQVGSFSWSLSFRWTPIQRVDREAAEADPTLPIRSPTMAGGLFAIDKSFFMDLGMYDPGFQIWGAENLELSFKTWMCGGTLSVMVCSHVGHVFRTFAPYQGMGNALMKNNKRLAEVWLDEYQDFFYLMQPSMRHVHGGDVSKQRALRSRLGCKSFRWYLENVFPESSWPHPGRLFGRIRSLADTNSCLYGSSRKTAAKLGKCNNKQLFSQLWEYTNNSEIRHDEFCLDYDGSALVTFNCHGMKGNQFWKWDNKTKLVPHGIHKSCLTVDKSIGKEAGLVMEECSEDKPGQRWEMPQKFRPENIFL